MPADESIEFLGFEEPGVEAIGLTEVFGRTLGVEAGGFETIFGFDDGEDGRTLGFGVGAEKDLGAGEEGREEGVDGLEDGLEEGEDGLEEGLEEGFCDGNATA